VLDDKGEGSWESVIAGIDYAASKAIPVLNASLGGYDPETSWSAFQQSISQYSGLLVCSAGNDNTDVDQTAHYPSAFTRNNANVISVGSSDGADTKVSSSNYGTATVDLFAPGYNIKSTVPLNDDPSGYANKSGTSMAAPHVSGVAALVLSVYPQKTAAELKEIICSSGDLVKGLNSYCETGRRLNAYRALIRAGRQATIITTAQQLSDIRYNPNGYYKLGANISLSGQWYSIPAFGANGIFDGADYAIYNMTISGRTIGGSAANFGLFEINYGFITNLYMSNIFINIDGNQASVWSNVGAVCGINEGSIRFVRASGSYYMSRNYSTRGGIVGENRNRVFSCESSGLLESCGDIGGIAGQNYYDGSILSSTVLNCQIRHYFVDNNHSVGGIVGYQHSGGIFRCTNASSVSYIGAWSDSRDLAPRMGQLVGHLASGSVGGFLLGSVNQGSLHTESWKGGFLWFTTYTHNQAQYVSNGYAGRVN
jgi:hypothetical protein